MKITENNREVWQGEQEAMSSKPLRISDKSLVLHGYRSEMGGRFYKEYFLGVRCVLIVKFYTIPVWDYNDRQFIIIPTMYAMPRLSELESIRDSIFCEIREMVRETESLHKVSS